MSGQYEFYLEKTVIAKDGSFVISKHVVLPFAPFPGLVVYFSNGREETIEKVRCYIGDDDDPEDVAVVAMVGECDVTTLGCECVESDKCCVVDRLAEEMSVNGWGVDVSESHEFRQPPSAPAT